HLVYLPTNASWMNMIERVFSKYDKDILQNSNFETVREAMNRTTNYFEKETSFRNWRKMDIPVCTSIDFTMLPYYVELFNLSGRGYHFSHNIVIVGFDERNGTVYYHDPLCSAYTSAEDGMYAPLPIDIFRKSVYSVHWCIWNGWEEGYTTLAFKKARESLPKEKAFEMAHERNIQRMKGNASAYDGQSCRENFCVFGVDALRALKKDFGLASFAIRAPFLVLITKFYPYLSLIMQSYEFTAMEKHNVSEFLYQNSNLSPICKRDALLLETEADHWKEMKSYMAELNDIMDSLLETMLYAMPIIQSITETINKIIDVEMDIISG
ncbi:MAG: C39 family peptidase, partial [Candidatus Thermoplasmatota archaeon]|nr:C39 family peptidase [Candidatus Thermoplasmatota archaeon]